MAYAKLAGLIGLLLCAPCTSKAQRAQAAERPTLLTSDPGERAVVVASPFRLSERSSTSPGVAASACSIGSATKRETSVAAAPG